MDAEILRVEIARMERKLDLLRELYALERGDDAGAVPRLPQRVRAAAVNHVVTLRRMTEGRRVCDVCEIEKGRTAFTKFATVCRKCEKGEHVSGVCRALDEPSKPPVRRDGGEAAVALQVCDGCHVLLGPPKFPRGGTTCVDCLQKQGRDRPIDLKPKDRAAGTLPSNGYRLTLKQYRNWKHGADASLHAAIRKRFAGLRGEDSVVLYAPSKTKTEMLETLTGWEILGT